MKERQREGAGNVKKNGLERGVTRAAVAFFFYTFPPQWRCEMRQSEREEKMQLEWMPGDDWEGV